MVNSTELEDLLNREPDTKKLNLPQLIDLEVIANNIELKGLYDPGSNITILTYRALKKIPNTKLKKQQITFKTMSGGATFEGITRIKLKIFEIEEDVLVYVADKPEFRYDIIIGLDTIKQSGPGQGFKKYNIHILRIK